MEFPFFGNYWNYPSHHWSESEPPATNPYHWAGIDTPAMNKQTRCRSRRNRMEVDPAPVMNRQMRSPFPESPQPGTEMENQARTQLPKSASKIVDIPVRFVGSETMKKTAALKIQKVFRGLLVRKSVKKIDAIRKEVDEIEKRVSEKETIFMMRRDAKERLKMNEMLMALLLKLDSIRGVDSGVRDFRKAVIKKAILLQERVDAIVDGDSEMVETRETMQMQEEEEESEVVDEEMKANHDLESEQCNSGDFEPVMEESGDQPSELQHFQQPSEVEGLKEEDLMDIQQQPELVQAENLGVAEEKKNGSNNRDLMEKWIKGNDMLTSLVTELCHRQELQRRLLSSLSQRVENLEKAFQTDRSKRKKKRNANANKL